MPPVTVTPPAGLFEDLPADEDEPAGEDPDPEDESAED